MNSAQGTGLPGPSSTEPDPTRADDFDLSSAIVARLRSRDHPFDRYRIGEQIGEGAMGRILKVRDEDLHRDMAMKVMKAAPPREGATSPSPYASQRLARFVDEAQITGQLDHPGIVPVHEIGLDPSGQVFFTMKLVRGRTLREVFDLAWKREEDWSTTRVLGALLKVCEAMSYAHEHKVIHRDLKPGNIMIGRFGEVLVMDWGLARLLDRPDPKDIRVRERAECPTTAFVSDRGHGTPATPDSPLMTMDGDVIGTPAYMSPEQASGHIDRVGIQTDVYAIGAILYHLLARRMPYVEPGVAVDNYAIWRWVQVGPPTSLSKLAVDAPAELVAICERAMAREPSRRYASAQELGDDLRAYLETRVVRAYRVGPVVELRKWVARNRGTAVLASAVVVLVIGAAVAFAWQERLRAKEALLAGDARQASDLLRRAPRLSAAREDGAVEIEAWLRDARAVVSREPEHRRRLDELVATARGNGKLVEKPVVRSPDLAGDIEFATKQAADWGAILEMKHAAVERGELSGEALERARIAFDVMPREIEFWAARAKRLAPSRETELAISDPALQLANESWIALLDDIRTLREYAIPDAEARLESARRLRTISIDSEAAAWTDAVRSIADVAKCPAYHGLTIVPQLGLVPLGRDASSGLWEFWVVLSGDRPRRGADRRWVIGPTTGMVLVLIPGGIADVGADPKNPAAVHFDPRASATEIPARVELAPFFLSKYEMTQGQWLHETGEMPSHYYSGEEFERSPRITRAHPVENVTWSSSEQLLRRLDLTFPTEAQWEYAARAGISTPYICGNDPECLAGSVNFADRTLQSMMKEALREPPSVADGYGLHAPVGSFAPNAFGLHDMLGNVAEWCRDWYTDSCDKAPPMPPDGERLPTTSRMRVIKGGSFMDSLSSMRFSRRDDLEPGLRRDTLGVRAARQLHSDA